jgi:hypothetical protein
MDFLLSHGVPSLSGVFFDVNVITGTLTMLPGAVYSDVEVKMHFVG